MQLFEILLLFGLISLNRIRLTFTYKVFPLINVSNLMAVTFFRSNSKKWDVWTSTVNEGGWLAVSMRLDSTSWWERDEFNPELRVPSYWKPKCNRFIEAALTYSCTHIIFICYLEPFIKAYSSLHPFIFKTDLLPELRVTWVRWNLCRILREQTAYLPHRTVPDLKYNPKSTSNDFLATLQHIKQVDCHLKIVSISLKWHKNQ